MALWRFRSRIESAVLGELTGAAELALRAHLRGCVPCRAHYEVLSDGALALSPALAAAREQARLFAALGPSSPPPARRAAMLWAAGLATAAAVLLVLMPRTPEDIVLRGDGQPAQMPVGALLVYVRDADGGAVRLAADFPLAGVANLSRAQEAQLFVRHPWARARVVVTATSSQGSSRVLADVEVAETRNGSAAVGASFPMTEFPIGSWRLTAVLGEAGSDAGAVVQLDGTLEVGP